MSTAVASNRRPTDIFVSPLACLLFGVATLVLFVASWAWPGDEGWWRAGTSAIFACGLFAFHLAFSSRYLNGFDPGLWIPLMMVLYYFGTPLIVMLGPAGIAYDPWWFPDSDPPQLTRSLVVALLSLVAFLFGFHIAGLRNCNLRIETRSPDRTLFFPGLFLTFGGLGMTGIGVALAGPAAIFGAYGDISWGSATGKFDPRMIFGGLHFVNWGIFALVSAYDGRRRSPLLFAAIGSALALAFDLGTGNRGGIAALVFSAGWVFTVWVRPISKWSTIPLIVPGLLLMPIIAEYRQYKSIEQTKEMNIATLSLNALAEMGGTVQAFCYTLDYIPKDKDYDYGMSFVGAIIAAIPNVGLTAGKSFTLDPLKHAPSQWITWTINPIKFAYGGGYGYAIGAEWYFNFGIPGVCLGLIATGYVTARIRNAARRGGLMLVWSGVYAHAAFVLVRNAVIAPTRAILWGLIGLLVLRFVFSSLGIRAPAPPSDASSTAPGQRGSNDPVMSASSSSR
jgi:oligosaccharide repeat unit polymerase